MNVPRTAVGGLLMPAGVNLYVVDAARPATCECGEPALVDVVVIQATHNPETGERAVHGPDRVCENCVMHSYADWEHGVMVLHLMLEEHPK